MIDCPDCGSEHLGERPCGLSYAERLRSVRLSETVRETVHDRPNSYYDPEPIRQVFGEDARDKMLDATDGLGYAQEDANGDLWHKDRGSGEWEPVTDEQLDRVYLGGSTEREATAAP